MLLFSIDEIQLNISKFISQKVLIKLCLAMNVNIFPPALLTTKRKVELRPGKTGYKCPCCKEIISNNPPKTTRNETSDFDHLVKIYPPKTTRNKTSESNHLVKINPPKKTFTNIVCMF